MKITIDSTNCDKVNLSIEECFTLLLIIKNIDTSKTIQSLINKGRMVKKSETLLGEKAFLISQETYKDLENIILDSEPSQKSLDNLKQLALHLKEIFPKGKKEGTNIYWSEGVALVVKRLRIFFKKYSTDFTEDQIITATKAYVEGFRDNHQYMRTLKYFIFKDEKSADGNVEVNSDLLNYLENAGQEETLNDNWQTTLK